MSNAVDDLLKLCSEAVPICLDNPTLSVEDVGKYAIGVGRRQDHKSECDKCHVLYKFNGSESFCPSCGTTSEDCADVAAVMEICQTKPAQMEPQINYNHQQEYKQLENLIFQYVGRGISPDIVKSAHAIYLKLKQPPNSYVFRGKGRLGIIGACIEYMCVAKHVHRSVHDIAQILGIEDCHVSRGIRQLSDFIDRGKLRITQIPKTHLDYINHYFYLLDIPTKFVSFVVDLISRAGEKNLHIICDSRMSTRCVGTIYMLVNRVPSLSSITKEIISTKCSISKTTFIKYYSMLCSNFILLRKVFKQHKIPMPITWKITHRRSITRKAAEKYQRVRSFTTPLDISSSPTCDSPSRASTESSSSPAPSMHLSRHTSFDCEQDYHTPDDHHVHALLDDASG